MASSSATAKAALDKVAWEFVQDECTAKEQLIKSLQRQLEVLKDENDKQESYINSFHCQESHLWNSMNFYAREVERLRAKNKEVESENDRLRDEKVSTPPAKKLCTIARR